MSLRLVWVCFKNCNNDKRYKGKNNYEIYIEVEYIL